MSEQSSQAPLTYNGADGVNPTHKYRHVSPISNKIQKNTHQPPRWPQTPPVNDRMWIHVPSYSAVYRRAHAGEDFHFAHFTKRTYSKAVPTDLTVKELRQYSCDLRRPKGSLKATLLVLVTGDQAEEYSILNWGERKTSTSFCAARYPVCRERIYDFHSELQVRVKG